MTRTLSCLFYLENHTTDPRLYMPYVIYNSNMAYEFVFFYFNTKISSFFRKPNVMVLMSFQSHGIS
jgi:hypothetical protein